MHIPLWLPWVVALALAVPAYFATSLQRAAQHQAEPLVPEFLVKTWSAAVIAVAVAAVLTFDHEFVTAGELHQAASKAGDGLEGTGHVGADQLQVAISDRLGRDVVVEAAAVGQGDTTARYEVRLSDDDSGPVACVRVAQDGDDSDPYVSLSADEGRCD